MIAREVRRGMVVIVPPAPPVHDGYSEVVRQSLPSHDGERDTRVLQLANGVSWVLGPDDDVVVIPA